MASCVALCSLLPPVYFSPRLILRYGQDDHDCGLNSGSTSMRTKTLLALGLTHIYSFIHSFNQCVKHCSKHLKNKIEESKVLVYVELASSTQNI